MLEDKSRLDLDFRPTKTIDIDWQVVDDDLPITGSGENLPGKPLKSSARAWNSHTTQKKPAAVVSQFQSARIDEIDPNPSSYFPAPQSDIKQPPYNNLRLMYDDGNERQWKKVPAPVARRLSDSSGEQRPATTRMVPVTSIPISDENLCSSATGTDSLGTKISRAASHEHRHHQPTKKNGLVNKHAETTSRTKADVEHVIYSDRQRTPRDQTDFFNNRNDLLAILSSRLSTANRRSSSATTPKHSKGNSHSESYSKTHVSSATKNSARLLKSSSSSSTISLASHLNQERKPTINRKKPQVPSSVNLHKFDPTLRRSSHRIDHSLQRTVPLRVQHSSESEEQDRARSNTQRRQASSYPTRNQTHAKTHQIPKHRNEPKQPVEPSITDQNTLTPNSTPLPASVPTPGLVPSVLMQAPLDHMKLLYNRSLSPTSIANISNPWLISTSYRE